MFMEHIHEHDMNVTSIHFAMGTVHTATQGLLHLWPGMEKNPNLL